jgi:hypothetical protein
LRWRNSGEINDGVASSVCSGEISKRGGVAEETLSAAAAAANRNKHQSGYASGGGVAHRRQLIAAEALTRKLAKAL